jgi:hypothetical protein
MMFIYLFHYLYTVTCCLMTEYVPTYNVINRTSKDNTSISIFVMFICVLLHYQLLMGVVVGLEIM